MLRIGSSTNTVLAAIVILDDCSQWSRSGRDGRRDGGTDTSGRVAKRWRPKNSVRRYACARPSQCVTQ